ncbi:MAG: relaxase/mobilization nuclease domain-containing protein [Eubacteriales bacterium]|nr:relaxase/mobilization nuclease domain-containing protein [Eubacteriales bacterium]
MAATRLIAMHINKGKTLAQCLEARTDYAQNPEKTEKGNLISAYECDPMTCDEEFLLSKRQYRQYTGREQISDVIAYQIRQSFKPGEVTAEEANRIGYELAMAITKGKHAFIVATHTDRPHIHNHIVFNSTALDCRHKFRDFKHSGLALQHVSDRICLEHRLSVIEPKRYKDRLRRSSYPKRPKLRDDICKDIDRILLRKPKSFDQFLDMLEAEGYEVKRGKQPALKGKGQQRFIRLRSLGEGYTEPEIRSAIAGTGRIIKRNSTQVHEKPRFNLLIDMQERIQGKGAGYERWAKVYNLKQISETFLFMREQHVESFEDLYAKTEEAVAGFNELNDTIKTAESKMAANLALQKHIQNYAKTKDVYAAYRKSGYSRKFYEEHRAELTLHKAAKDAFNEYGGGRLPTIQQLRQEYAELISQKKEAYKGYREAKRKMQDYLKARQNVETFYGDELREEREAAKSKQEEQKR